MGGKSNSIKTIFATVFPSIKMIHSTNTQIRQLAVHYVGNKSLDEGVELSEAVMDQPDDDTVEALLKYFLSSIKGEEIYEFCHDSDLELNELFSF